MIGGDTVEHGGPEAGKKPPRTSPTMEGPPAANPPEPATAETFISDPNIGEDGAAGDTGVDQHTQVTVISAADHPQEPKVGETLALDSTKSTTSPAGPKGMVIGDYQVLSELGRGGMGVVYKAKHQKLNRTVALKMILAGPHAGNDAMARFITEARAVAHLQHPGIVQIFDIGEHEGLPFFSLEFVEGCDLQQKLDHQPQDAVFSAKMVEKLARAMQYAHDNNILHRDIKPSNVLLDVDGVPKITDFGLAKQVDGDDASTSTQAGTIMGSPSYMPPEQARGEISSVTPRSDLYSLGAVLYEMLTGRAPFLAKKPLETVMQVVNNDPVSPRELQPEIPVDIETICLKAMQKEQASRYQSCNELADDLKRFLDGEPILARPVSKLERLIKWCKRNPRIAVPSGLAMTAIAATAIIASWAWQTTSALAANLQVEKSNVTEQRDEAQKQKGIAQNNERKAVAAQEEAEKQKGIAEDNEKLAVAAKEEAEEQRTAALAAKKDAEEKEQLAKKQAVTALKSIQYVLTEVDTKLQSQPQLSEVRLALMDSLSKKWDDIDVEMAGGVRGEAIATLMTTRKKIADIYSTLDEVKKADEEYAKLHKSGLERIKIKNGSDSSRYNLAVVCTSWAAIRKRVGNDPAEALKLHEEANALMTDMVENPRPEPGSPGPIRIQIVTAAMIQNTGVEYLHSGLVDKTADKWDQALKMNQRILAAIPTAEEFDNKETLRARFRAVVDAQVDKGYLSLGYIQLRRGQTEEALGLYAKAIEASRVKHLAKPSDAEATATLGGYLDMLGSAYLWLDRPGDADAPLKEGNTLLKAAHAADPDVALTTRSLGFNHYHLALLADIQSNPDEKKVEAKAGRDLYAALVEKSPDRKNKMMLMLSEAQLGNAEAARPLIDEYGKTDKPDTEAHLDRSRALCMLSRFAKDEESKQRLIGEALTAIERCVKDGYSDPFRLTHENDLDPIQDQPRFKELIEQLKSK